MTLVNIKVPFDINNQFSTTQLITFMANLTASQVNELKAIGITGLKSKEEAITKMVELLEQQQVSGVDDEPFENLIMYCQAFVGIANDAEVENDALAREVEEEDTVINRAAQDEDDDEEEEHEDESSRPLDEASSFVPWSDFWGGGAP